MIRDINKVNFYSHYLKRSIYCLQVNTNPTKVIAGGMKGAIRRLIYVGYSKQIAFIIMKEFWFEIAGANYNYSHSELFL